MRLLIQRVREASVTIGGVCCSRIGAGLLVFVGVGTEDTDEDLEYLAGKLVRLRIFDDEAGVMNLDLLQTGGEVLVVSQFTLLGDARHGKRPSFTQSAPPDEAKRLYERAVVLFREKGIKTETGQFQAHMEVSLINDGPVTILIDSRKTF